MATANAINKTAIKRVENSILDILLSMPKIFWANLDKTHQIDPINLLTKTKINE